MTLLRLADLPPLERRALDLARRTRRNAYAPYSRFPVGAAVISASGRLYAGCNVESADYTLTTHAEMNAIDTMVAAGERRLRAVVLCLAASPPNLPVPCGLCRQKISEFADHTRIPVFGALLDRRGTVREIRRWSLDELLPFAFGKSHLRIP